MANVDSVKSALQYLSVTFTDVLKDRDEAIRKMDMEAKERESSDHARKLLSDRVTALDDRIARLQLDNNRLEAHVEHLTNENTSLMVELSDSSTLSESLNRLVRSGDIQLAGQKAELEKRLVEITEQKAHIDQLTTALSDDHSLIESLDLRLKAKDDQINEIVAKAHEFEISSRRKVEVLSDELDQLRQSRTADGTLIDELRQSIRLRDQAIDELKKAHALQLDRMQRDRSATGVSRDSWKLTAEERSEMLTQVESELAAERDSHFRANVFSAVVTLLSVFWMLVHFISE